MPSATTWPALTWEPQTPWVHRDALASRRATRRNSGTFSSAVPASIAALNVELSPALRARLQENATAMTRFDERLHHIGGIPFSAVLLRGESASSSQIENLTVSARKLSLAVLGASGSKVGVNAELVARNVHAMRAALNTAENISVDNILAMHRELTRGLQQDSGVLRTQWVWIKGDSPVTADYVAPHHERVPAALEDLVAFMNRRDIDPLAQAAIAHAQFETIHPFTDGNGRTGRALISALLLACGVTRHVILPVSSGLLHDTDGYIQALTDYRAGEPSPSSSSSSTPHRRQLPTQKSWRKTLKPCAMRCCPLPSVKPLSCVPSPTCAVPSPPSPHAWWRNTRGGPGLVCIASSTAWWSCKFCVKNASKFRGKKCGLSPLSTAPSTTLQHERDGADRCASGFDNPRENSAAVGGFPCTEL